MIIKNGSLLHIIIFTLFFPKVEQSSDSIIIPVLKICECTHRTKLLGALYGYKGILLLFGVFLAWETRNVTIPALNDSKYIGMSVYNVVILSAIGVTVSMVLKRTVYYELLHVLVSVVVLLSTTVTLTMVFLPKVRKGKKRGREREGGRERERRERVRETNG